MPYRYRAPMVNRRYNNPGFNSYTPAYAKNSSGSDKKDENHDEDTLQKAFEIPMPNIADVETANETEASVPEDVYSRDVRSHRQSFFNILKSRIHLDDIILIVLIFILIDDGLKDEFLLILLLYIFLF